MKTIKILGIGIIMALLLAQKVNAISVYTDGVGGYSVRHTFPSGNELGISGDKIEEESFSYSLLGIDFYNIIKKFSSENIKIFLGVEGNYIFSFRGENSNGNGFMIYSSLGGIVSLWEKIFFLFEIGPSVVCLKDKATGIKVKKIDPAIHNMGVGIKF